MNIDELYSAVQALINGSKTLVLKTGDLPSAEISRTLDFFFNGRMEILQCTEPVKETQSVKIASGKLASTFRGMNSPHAETRFILTAQGTPQLDIVFTTENELSFEKLFPATKYCLFSQLAFEKISLRFTSLPQSEGYAKLQARIAPHFYSEARQAYCNLFFTGVVKVPEAFAWIKTWIPDSRLTLKGAIELVGETPRFLVETETFRPGALGHLSVGIGLGFVSLFAEPDQKAPLEHLSWYRLSGDLSVKDRPVFPVEALLQHERPDHITFRMLVDKELPTTLADLKPLLDGTELSALLPTERFPVISDVGLLAFELDLSLDPFKLTMLNAKIGTPADKKYELLPGLLHCSALGIELNMVNPASAQRQVEVILSADTHVQNALVDGKFHNRISLPRLAFEVELAEGSTVNLLQFLKPVLPELPGMPDKLICSSFNLTGNPAGGSLSADFEVETELNIGYVTLQSAEAGFVCVFDPKERKLKEAEASLAVYAMIGSRFEVSLFGHASKNGWMLGGSWSSTTPLKLSELLPAGIELPPVFANCSFRSLKAELDSAEGSFSLAFEGNLEFDLGDPGRIYCRKFEISVTKTGGSYEWEIELNGGLQLFKLEDVPGREWLADIEGTLRIAGGPKKFTTRFKAADGKGWIENIPLLIPARIENEKPVFSKAKFRIEEAGFEWDKTKGFELTGGIHFIITDTWAPLKKCLPENGIRLGFSFGSSGATIGLAKNSTIGFDIGAISIPAIGDFPPKDLGPSRFTIREMKLGITRKFELSASVTLNYYLPQHLNRLFGDGIRLFETYDPSQIDKGPSFGVEFYAKIGSSISVGAKISSVPTRVLEESGDPLYWALHLGERDERNEGKYGCIWIGKTDMSFDMKKGGFAIDAKWKVKKDPGIPLKLLKDLLSRGIAPSLAQRLPDVLTIPVKDPPKFVDRNGINIENVRKFFGVLPAIIESQLRTISPYVKKLPVHLQEYLNMPDISEMEFKLVITPTGSVDVALVAPKGLRLLFIQPAPIPALQGMTLRSFSFGQIFGGFAFKLGIDATFDTFDFITLAAALKVPEPLYPHIGTPTTFQNRLHIGNLTVLIFYQASGIPIPVPVFYDQLGISYRGLGNTVVESSLKFPMPKLNLTEVGDFTKNLISFFTDPKFPMPDKTYTDSNIRFSFGPNYIQSGILNTGKVGIDKEHTLDLYKTVASLLNTIKFFDVESLIRSIPFEDRVGKASTSINFIAMSNLSAAWLLTTPMEFSRPDVYNRFLKEGEKPELFMRLLPATMKPTDRGLVLFLRGTWTTDYSSFSVGFGSVALNASRFATGFYFSGNVKGIFDVDVRALVKMDPPEVPFELEGDGYSRLVIIGITFFTGSLLLRGSYNRFLLEGKMVLVNVPYVLYIGTKPGHLIGGDISKTVFLIKGNFMIKPLIFEFSGEARISTGGIVLEVVVANVPHRLGFEVVNGEVYIVGTLPLGLISIMLEIYFTNNSLRSVYKTTAIADLMSLEFHSKAIFQPLSSELKVHFKTILSPDPVFTANGQIMPDGSIYISSAFSLLPEGSVFNVKGDLKGNFWSNGRISFTGSAGVGIYTNLGNITLSGSITVDNSGIRLIIENELFKITGKVHVHAQKLYIAGEIYDKKCNKTYQGYLSDVFPFIHTGVPPGYHFKARKTKQDLVYRLLFEQVTLSLGGLKYKKRIKFEKKKYGTAVVRSRKSNRDFITIDISHHPEHTLSKRLLLTMRKQLGARRFSEWIVWKKAELRGLFPASRKGLFDIEMYLPGLKAKELRSTKIRLKADEIVRLPEHLAAAFLAKLEKQITKETGAPKKAGKKTSRKKAAARKKSTVKKVKPTAKAFAKKSPRNRTEAKKKKPVKRTIVSKKRKKTRR